MIYQIGICDDENSTCSELESIIMDYFKIAGLNVQLNIWNCAEDFMRDVPAKVDVDILFLDIEMPDYNGIYVGEYIRNDINNDTMHIIYVSSKTNYAMELFKIHPYDFIIKPIDKDAIIAASKETKFIVTAEEHNIIGGLGSAVTEVVCEKCPAPVLRVGVEDVFGRSGPAVELLHIYGLDAAHIEEKAKEAIKLK